MASSKISVIIPCYNHGIYIQDAIDSVEASTYLNYEIIIVNDGSTDSLTVEKMNELSQRGYQVINQFNQGPAKARNNGIAIALGDYILPLDADNKIRPTYMEKAVTILDHQSDIGVVYGKSVCFGAVEGRHYSGKLFDPIELFFANYIDNLAIFRKSVWEQVGGYDVDMLIGDEDWDFWMMLQESGVGFSFINEVLFDYRVVPHSRRSKAYLFNNMNEVKKYLFIKHLPAYQRNYFQIAMELKEAKSQPFKFFLKYKLSYLYKTLVNIKKQFKQILS